MPIAIAYKTLVELRNRHYISDSQFTNIIIGMASVVPIGAATGLAARLARTPLGYKLVGYATKAAGSFFATLLGYILAEAIDGNNPFARDAIMALIYQTTGLELKTLDEDGAKHAVGALMAKKINEKYGTSFAPFYPLENIIEDVKAQLLSEIMLAVDVNIA